MNRSEVIGNSSGKIIHDQDTSKKSLLQCRYIVAAMGFLTFAIFNIQLISTSVSIVAMVNNTAILSQTDTENRSVTCVMNIKNTTQDTKQESTGEFNWSPELQGYILGASNLGYLITQMPGGMLSETIGAKITVTGGLLISSISHFVTPFAAWGSSYLMIAVQLLRGLGQGLLIASVFVLGANWTPRQERGITMTFILSGLCVGAIIGGVASGSMCASTVFGGWPSVYYIFGGLGLILSFAYVILVYESPKYHPRVTNSERKFILENQETDLEKKRPPTPWRKILTSVPFYAMTLAVFGNYWMAAHFLIVQPTFLGTILHFTIEENGLFASVPFALQFSVTLIASWISDWLLRKNYASLNKVRKGFTLLSYLGYSLCVLGIYFAGCDKSLSTVFSVLAIGFGGFANAGCVINPVDLSPTFTGSIMGLSSLIASFSNYIVPVLVGYLTNDEQSLEQWNKMFFISIAVVMSSGIVFCVFGSAEVQPWNSPSDEDFEAKSKSEDNFDHKRNAYDNHYYQSDAIRHQ